MNTAEWQAARGGLDARENTLRSELLALPAAPARLAWIEGARQAWPDMTLGERRELLRLFIEKVVINRQGGFDLRGVGAELLADDVGVIALA
jgi:site-specific DNA recombinase